MRRDENWAIAPERIRDFFRQQPDARETAEGFCFRGCTLQLIPLSGQAMGKWQIPRTRLIFEGEESDVQAVYRRFFLRFLSAGG